MSRYRSDIDGLRAIAVLGVMGFHSAPTVLPGGFAGVDVFFVISGYLISSLIFDEQRRGTFSLQPFYERRVKRLLAPLLLTVVGVLAGGFFLLMPGHYRALAGSALAALGFAANVHFWKNTGYFDAPAEGMPLLHTWSLGVEEQFYVLWPLALLAVFRWRLSDAVRRRLMAGLTFASFLLWVALKQRDAVFYLPFSRAWQLLLGGLIATVVSEPKGRWQGTVAGFGLALTILSFCFVGGSQASPLLLALPALGAGLMTLCAEGTFLGGILSIPPLVFLGRVSYAVYLFHWPLLAYVRHYLHDPDLLPVDAFGPAIDEHDYAHV